MIPSLFAELTKLRDPRTLKFGVISGYMVLACFGILTWVAVASDTGPWHWLFGALLAAKLCTNTLALVGLRLDRFALGLTVGVMIDL